MNPAEIIEKVGSDIRQIGITDSGVIGYSETLGSKLSRRLIDKITRIAVMATLDALREPSEAQLEIGCDAYAQDEVIVYTETLGAAWRAMIDQLKREVAG